MQLLFAVRGRGESRARMVQQPAVSLFVENVLRW